MALTRRTESGSTRDEIDRARSPHPADAPERDEGSLTAARVLELQRTLGNHATGALLSGVRPARPILQRLTVMEAFEAAVVRNRLPSDWYSRVCVPALETIATKAGQTLDGYLAGLTGATFMTQVNTLREDVRSEPRSQMFTGLFTRGPVLIDSEAYPGKKRVKGTNLFINDGALAEGKPTPAILSFIDDYNAGRLAWYRGLSVSHFAWNALRTYGTLASEGTADTPTFTMDNPNPHRWLPGLYERDGNCNGIAMTVSRDEPGVRDVMTRTNIPTGAVVRYAIAPGTPVAYLNDGEQVVRGPITGASVTVAGVYVQGPGGLRETGTGIPPTDLPPGAPYHAAVGAPALATWEVAAQSWVAAH